MTPYFFGFGSLVNTATHTYDQTQPASLPGWRRTWIQTHAHHLAFLSAVPCPQTEIEGLVAAVPNANWVALDLRETGYDRLDISEQINHSIENKPEVSLYSVRQNVDMQGTRKPILLSYLDVVVQGYFQVFGADGVERFFETTAAWDHPIIDDRNAPRYPRHQTLSSQEVELTNHYVTAKELTLIE